MVNSKMVEIDMQLHWAVVEVLVAEGEVSTHKH